MAPAAPAVKQSFALIQCPQKTKENPKNPSCLARHRVTSAIISGNLHFTGTPVVVLVESE